MNQSFRQPDPKPQSEAIKGLELIDAEVDSLPAPQPPELRSRAARIVLGASLVLIAFCLR
ncbi:cyanate transporter, partial [Mesorhizobium sp. M7D.F.Ca.US.004.03.1.1]